LIRSTTKPVPIIEGVKVLQTILIAQGWATFTEADGRFGEDTEKAVIEMQKALGFTKPDGKYGPKTAAKLGEYLSNR
jgi:peptidoglycan hydrolase-like protein with peptidoglycan-binding domain